jgi:DNA-directed RNA polymerase specialized sigma24 family protein
MPNCWLGHQREPAFHALVARYAALVHMAAKRTSGDETLAAEASQLTFILLARKAKSLASRSSIAGWLHLTAMMQAKNLIRQNRRENHKRQLLQSAMEIHSPNQHSHTGRIVRLGRDAISPHFGADGSPSID